MLRIAICGQTTDDVTLLERDVREWGLYRQFNIQTKIFVSGEEVLAEIELAGYFDIVLMDTHLKGNMGGIDTAEKIRQIYEYFCLIIMSGRDKYYKEVFKLHPFQYLEKPIIRRKLIESLDQAADRYGLLHETFTFRFKGMAYCIRLSEVLYFVSDRRVIRIRMESGKEYVFYEKLDELEKRLLRYTIRFLRVHQSFLINGRQIEQYHHKFVVMRNQEMIPVSFYRRNAVENGIKNYIRRY